MRQSALLQAPTVIEYVPLVQLRQACEGYSMYCPALHETQAAEEVDPLPNENEPRIHSTHALLFGAPTVVEYVPAVQLAQSCDGYTMYCPALQVWHAADDDAPS